MDFILFLEEWESRRYYGICSGLNCTTSDNWFCISGVNRRGTNIKIPGKLLELHSIGEKTWVGSFLALHGLRRFDIFISLCIPGRGEMSPFPWTTQTCNFLIQKELGKRFTGMWKVCTPHVTSTCQVTRTTVVQYWLSFLACPGGILPPLMGSVEDRGCPLGAIGNPCRIGYTGQSMRSILHVCKLGIVLDNWHDVLHLAL